MDRHFFDMEYGVRKKQIGVDRFASIYFSSSIIQDVSSKIDPTVRTSVSIEGEGEQEGDDDSDLEEGWIPEPSEARANGSTGAKDGIPCPNLLPGALTTWRSLFLYLCFNEITFRPLRSQESSSVPKGGDNVLACSPKSVYRLAQLLGLSGLANLAFRDIMSKMTSENIVCELFSGFTAQNYKLLERQSSILTSTLRAPKTTQMVQQRVRDAADGNSPHCYHALKLAFGKTVDAISQKIADDERKAREEAELRARTKLKRTRLSGLHRGEHPIDEPEPRMECSRCGRLSHCSSCGRALDKKDVCSGCEKAFG